MTAVGLARKISKIPELIKVENSVFVLPFTYIGMLFAGNPSIAKFILITIALITARGAAFAANRYIGREYDKKNPRKRNWSNVNLYSKIDMLAILIFMAAVFWASAYMLNMLAFVLAPLILLIVILEPYTKRYTAHRHFSMGLIIGLGIIGGYIGAADAFPPLPLYILLLGYMCFSAGSDIIISIPNAGFDRKNGLKTYPSEYGIVRARRYSKYSHAAAAALFVAFGIASWSISICIAGLLSAFILYLEHANDRKNDAKSIGRLFLYYNAAVSIVMLIGALLYQFAGI